VIAEPAESAVTAIISVDGSGTLATRTCETPYMRSERKLGSTTPRTQSFFVRPKSPLETPKTLPRGSPEGSVHGPRVTAV
jgi:hypothetical protein